MNPKPIIDNYSTQLQAPAGGAISPLNGEFYKGGQFMCNQFDMPKGCKQKIKKIVDKTALKDNWREISVTAGAVRITTVTERTSVVFRGSGEEAAIFAKTLLDKKAEWYLAQGLVPHPTVLLMESKA